MLEHIAAKVISILDEHQGSVVFIDVSSQTCEVEPAPSEKGEPPFITGFGGISELAEILKAFSHWQGTFQVGGILSDGCYEFWIN